MTLNYARVFGLRFVLEEAIEDYATAKVNEEFARLSTPELLPMARAALERARAELNEVLEKVEEEEL